MGKIEAKNIEKFFQHDGEELDNHLNSGLQWQHQQGYHEPPHKEPHQDLAIRL